LCIVGVHHACEHRIREEGTAGWNSGCGDKDQMMERSWQTEKGRKEILTGKEEDGHHIEKRRNITNGKEGWKSIL